MSITLRKRKNHDGTTSLILDIYHDGKRYYEFLKDLKLLKVSTPIDRNENRERLKIAEQIKNKREQQLISEENQIAPSFKNKVDFCLYFEMFNDKYLKADKRVMEACLKKFRAFLKEEKISGLSARQLNEKLVFRFKEYLEQNLKGESPATYFKRFKKVIKQAVRDKIIPVNPANDITIKENEAIKKDVLDFREIQLLAKTPCGNVKVKNAFLFSCLTGLRYCDVKTLKWQNINDSVLKIVQQKTEHPVTINLNKNAIQIIGTKGNPNDLIFELPSHTGCLKHLTSWCRKAEINKKITWHCARHSFATNLIFYGADLNSASALLGHNSLDYTQRYVRVVDSLKEKAVQNLPTLNL